MAPDFKHRAKQKLKVTFHKFLLLTLTQQSLITIAILLIIAVLHNSLLSLFFLYSLFIVGFTVVWFKWQNREFRPVAAEPHLAVIAFLKEAVEIARTLVFIHREVASSDAGRRRKLTKNKTDAVLIFDDEFSLFLESFVADFVDSWFVEIASDPELKAKLVEILRLVGDDVVDRVARLDGEATTAAILRAYQTFFFQINEAKKSLRTKSLFDSNRRLKRVHTLEEAFEINFGLHPLVRSLISLGGFVSDKSPIKKQKRKATSSTFVRRHGSTTGSNVTSVDAFDYFHSLIGLLVELQTKKVVGGKSVRLSRVTRDALADVVSSGVLPILPKFVDPAFLYECVSDLVAPPSLETYEALVEAERKWLETKGRMADETLVETLVVDGVERTQSLSQSLSPFGTTDSLASMERYEDVTPKRTDRFESVSSQLSLNSFAGDVEYEDASMPQSMTELSDDIFVGDESSSNIPRLETEEQRFPHPSTCNLSEPPFQNDEVTIIEPTSQSVETPFRIQPDEGLHHSALTNGEALEPEPTFYFSQFQDYVDISLSTSALTAYQEAALDAALGVDDDDDDDNGSDFCVVEPRVDATTIDLRDGQSIADTDEVDSNANDSPRVPPPPTTRDDLGLSTSPPTVVLIRENGSDNAWGSCPDLCATDDSKRRGSTGSTTSQSTGSTTRDYDCFSVGDLPTDESRHFKPHLFSPAPEAAPGAGVESELGTSSASDLASSSSPPMDRLFLSIMIPNTVLCRDPHSGIKYTLYVIHYTAVYPCGPGGALEPRAGAVQRRFREFLTLHERLENSNSFKYSLKGIKAPSKWTGPFPWTNFDKDLIEKRRKDLEVYLKKLAELTDISCSQPLREFLAYDADPRIAYVQKAPNYSNLFRLDKFFSKGIKGSIEEVFSSQTSKPAPSAQKFVTAQQKTDDESPSVQEGKPNVPSGYHPTGSKDVFIKTTSPLLRGKDLSGNSSTIPSPRSLSPITTLATTVRNGGSNLAANLTLAANILCDEEQLLKKGVLDVQYCAPRRHSDNGEESTPLHVPFGPHSGWGLRGKKEQLRHQNYRRLRPLTFFSGRNLEKLCDHHAAKRSAKFKDRESDLEDLLFPKNTDDDGDDDDVVFHDAEEEKAEGKDSRVEEANPRRTLLLDAIVDIVFEAMRSHPTWINHETFLSKFKLVFGALTDHVIASEIGDVTTRPRWAYYMGLLRITLWPEVEPLLVERNEDEARGKAFQDLIDFFPSAVVECLGSEEVQSAINAIFDSVSNCYLNLHFLLTVLELLLQELYPEKDFAECLMLKLEKVAQH